LPYDLLIKGGHALDPGQNLHGVMDMAINGTKIAAVEPNIDLAGSPRVIELMATTASASQSIPASNVEAIQKSVGMLDAMPTLEQARVLQVRDLPKAC